MVEDGTYSYCYASFEGTGSGVFRVTGGRLRGGDIAGSQYWGRLSDEPDGRLAVEIRMRVPAGVFLVMGTSETDVPHLRNWRVVVPANFGGGAPFQVEAAPGMLWFIVVRVSDEYGVMIDNGAVFTVPPVPEEPGS